MFFFVACFLFNSLGTFQVVGFWLRFFLVGSKSNLALRCVVPLDFLDYSVPCSPEASQVRFTDENALSASSVIQLSIRFENYDCQFNDIVRLAELLKEKTSVVSGLHLL